MLEHVKRWWASGDEVFEMDELQAWAQQCGWTFKRMREVGGFSIEGAWGQNPWRMEWGHSQRSYIIGRELRLRMELSTRSDLQMLVLNQSLVELLEGRAFEHYTQTTQTIIDDSVPEEMRWLAIYPRVGMAAHPILDSRFGVWSSSASVASWWLEGNLARALETLATQWLPEEIPFVLMTLRGRLYLRAQISVPSKDLVACLHRLFLLAAQQQLRVSAVDSMPMPLGASETVLQSRLKSQQPPALPISSIPQRVGAALAVSARPLNVNESSSQHLRLRGV